MQKIAFCGLMCMIFVFGFSIANPVEAAKPVCGDGICSGGENYAKCPEDCMPPSMCGDGNCDSDEDRCTCSTDCGEPPPIEAACGDGVDNDCDGAIDCNDSDCIDDPLCPCNNNSICEEGEDCQTCPADCNSDQGGTCGACFKGKCDGVCNPKKEGPDCADCATYCCGLDTCDEALCGSDCGTASSFCGDGVVDPGEECDDGNTTPGDGCNENCQNESTALVPSNQFNIGDSIGEGEAADGTIGVAHHDKVWSTGYEITDIVNSLNERFEYLDPVAYYENTSNRDASFNHAVSGSVMGDFAAQAIEVVNAAALTPSGNAGMVTVLLGNNDVCEDSLSAMTDPAIFEAQYRQGLDILAGSELTRNAEIHVSGIPAIYWLWVAKKDSSGCRFIWWIGGVCQALLQNPVDDCASEISRDDPLNIYSGDGANCIRRKEFHRQILEVYNPILRDVLQEYIDDGRLPKGYYIDIFDIKFEGDHVNNGDCFHPSTQGHEFLADEQWCRSSWGSADPVCSP